MPPLNSEWEREVDLEPDLLCSAEELPDLEKQNCLSLFDAMLVFLREDRTSGWNPKFFLILNGIILRGIKPDAGQIRRRSVSVSNSHVPPKAAAIQDELNACAKYVDRWQTEDPIHAATFLLWRLNWIHPFMDGNGRTARAAAVYCLGKYKGEMLSNSGNFVRDVLDKKEDYWAALEDADEQWRVGERNLTEQVNVFNLECLLRDCFEEELFR